MNVFLEAASYAVVAFLVIAFFALIYYSLQMMLDICDRRNTGEEMTNKYLLQVCGQHRVFGFFLFEQEEIDSETFDHEAIHRSYEIIRKFGEKGTYEEFTPICASECRLTSTNRGFDVVHNGNVIITAVRL